MLHYSYLLVALLSVVLSSCVDSTGAESSFSVDDNQNMQLQPPALIASSRKIDEETLFVEVVIAFEGGTTSVVAERASGDNFWRGNLEVPTQTEFTVTITWFDLLDGPRVDLATSSIAFQPIDFPGEFSIRNDLLTFDSDDFDDDADTIVNLTERIDGTLPLDADSPGDGDRVGSQPLIEDGYVFVNNANGAVDEISDFDDALPARIVQTVPVINSTVPSSIDTPITLFFDDKLLLESLLGNILVLQNDQQVEGTVTISESSSGFAVFTFSPNQAYQSGVTVVLRLTGGENGILDDGGNPIIGNVGDSFEVSITTIDQNVDSFDGNFGFESFDQGVAFTGDGAVLSGTLGCLSAPAGANYAAISTGRTIVSNGSALDDTSSTVQIGPISVGEDTASLAFEYNFISAEFQEFVGSEFDDSAVLSISGPAGTFADVLTTVNTLGTAGNTECVGIPSINADPGADDYAGSTGWVEQRIDYGRLGSPIVITFTITDVSDEALTTILAIDNFRF